MTDKPTPPPGDAPMTDAQRATLKALSEQTGQAFDERLTQAQAARRIDELQGAEKAESPLEALGRAVGETVLGSDPEADGGRIPRG
jgi:hypothetical protein